MHAPNASQGAVGLPRIPGVTETRSRGNIPPKPTARQGFQAPPVVEPPLTGEPDSLLDLLRLAARGMLSNLPKLLTRILIPVLIVTALNFILMTIPTYSATGLGRTLLLTFVFLTASYNGVAQRTLFWVILLTVGRTLFHRFRQDGFKQVRQDLTAFMPALRQDLKTLGTKARYLLLLGCGLGFFIANFLTRNNRMDKQSVSLVVAVAIFNSLSKGTASLLLLFSKVAGKDLFRLLKKPPVTDPGPHRLLNAGVALGLIGNLLFAFVKIDFGGYLTGAVLAGVMVFLLLGGTVKGVKSH